MANDAAPLSDLAGAQAQDLLWRLGELGGNRGVNQVAGASVQRQAIDVVVPPKGKGPAAEPMDHDMAGLVVDGITAFEQLAGYHAALGEGGETTTPAIPERVPAGLRPAFGHLLRAKQQRYEVGMPLAYIAVRERLLAEGPMGLARYVLMGPQLALQESLERAYAAKTEWWLARPIFKALVAKYAALPGIDRVLAERLESMIGVLDSEMTTRIPTLLAQLTEATVPEEAERLKALVEAKEAIGVLEGIATSVSSLNDIAGKMAPAATDRRMGGMAADRPVRNFKDEELGSLTREEESVYFKVNDSPGSATIHKGLEILGGVKALAGIYSSGSSVGAAMHKLTDDKSNGWQMANASVSIANGILTPVQEAGELLLKGAAEVCEYVSKMTQIRHGTKQAWSLAQITNMNSSARAFRGMAGKLKGLEKVTGVLGVLSGALTFAEGLSVNDSESILGGAADALSGGVAVLESAEWVAGGTAFYAGIGALQIKTMATVAADMSRALQTIHNAELRESIEHSGGYLNAAARHAHVFDTAVGEWIGRQNSPDEMERTLGDHFARSAMEQVPLLNSALWNAMSSGIQGRISHQPAMAKAFAAQFGGREMARSTFDDLARRGNLISMGELMTHAEWLKELVPKMSKAFEAVYLEIRSLDKAAKGTVGLW